ncbi:MAG TPA: DnaB-like helicase C-terminal domain-containing protein [Acidimicrobiia bacterium]
MKPEDNSSRRSLASVLDEANHGKSGRRTFPTGFPLLDRVIGGGLRSRNLTLIGGAPGIGKTVTTLQWARNLAVDGASVVFVCYEHDEATLMSRLLHLELGELPTDERAGEGGRHARKLLAKVSEGSMTLSEAVIKAPALDEPYRQIQKYADRLWLVRASGSTTTLDELSNLVSGDTDALFVDYLQKVPLTKDTPDERERIVQVSQGLKDLAMRENIAVVAVSAADKEGLEAPRLRMHHLRGSSAVSYEADVIIILNEKFGVVSRQQLTHDLTAAESHKHRLIFTIEKNREGADMIDLEFTKQFDYLRVDPTGGRVTERLIDERIIKE